MHGCARRPRQSQLKYWPRVGPIVEGCTQDERWIQSWSRLKGWSLTWGLGPGLRVGPSVESWAWVLGLAQGWGQHKINAENWLQDFDSNEEIWGMSEQIIPITDAHTLYKKMHPRTDLPPRITSSFHLAMRKISYWEVMLKYSVLKGMCCRTSKITDYEKRLMARPHVQVTFL